MVGCDVVFAVVLVLMVIMLLIHHLSIEYELDEIKKKLKVNE